MYGYCPKCHAMRQLTQHHVYPQRFYGHGTDHTLHLCRDCHDNIERIIPTTQKLTKQSYMELTKAWLTGQSLPCFAYERRRV